MEKLYIIKALKITAYKTGKLVNVNKTLKSNGSNTKLEKIKYKLGRSYNPNERLKTLQTGNGDQLVLVEQYECHDCVALERKIHDHYKDKRVIGEWFYFTQEELNDCIKVINNYIIEIHNEMNINTGINPEYTKHLTHEQRLLANKILSKMDNILKRLDHMSEKTNY